MFMCKQKSLKNKGLLLLHFSYYTTRVSFTISYVWPVCYMKMWDYKRNENYIKYGTFKIDPLHYFIPYFRSPFVSQEKIC